MKVLIVSADSNFREIAARTVASRGGEAVAPDSSSLEGVPSNEYDLAIVDVDFKRGINDAVAYDVCRVARRLIATGGTPIAAKCVADTLKALLPKKSIGWITKDKTFWEEFTAAL